MTQENQWNNSFQGKKPRENYPKRTIHYNKLRFIVKNTNS